MSRAYSWPGNIRELQNFIERAVVLTRGAVLEPPLHELCLNHDKRPEPATLLDAERAHIQRTLQETQGQLARAAVLLDIPRSTLFYKIRRLGIPRASAPMKAPAC